MLIFGPYLVSTNLLIRRVNSRHFLGHVTYFLGIIPTIYLHF